MTEWTTIVFKYGSEWAPDSPGGLDVLKLSRDGRFRYENRVQGQATTVSGASWTEWLRTGTTAHPSPPGLVRA